ncbi:MULTISPECIES: hypothetical protein [unclassified Microcoleus]|uniref:hypothetical protein n=1 Tax=unclassified Microcoleus TaxID=2642155 RepID=UPI002FD26E9B
MTKFHSRSRSAHSLLCVPNSAYQPVQQLGPTRGDRAASENPGEILGKYPIELF